MEELNKKKVTELKQALKEKGLPTSGTKPELVKRLYEALAGADGGEDDGFQEIDEDDILNEDPSPVKENVPAAQVAKVSVTADSAQSNGSSKAADTPSVQLSNPSDDGDKLQAPKATDISKLSDAERMKIRAEKYGVVSEQSKKDLRAQRFGLPTSGSGGLKSSGNVPVDVDVLKKRAERFGAVVSSSLSKADEDERKRKRAERFGSSGTVSAKSNGQGSAEDEIKKKKRAERFGLAS